LKEEKNNRRNSQRRKRFKTGKRDIRKESRIRNKRIGVDTNRKNMTRIPIPF
jgi:hypothetical protein